MCGEIFIEENFDLKEKKSSQLIFSVERKYSSFKEWEGLFMGLVTVSFVVVFFFAGQCSNSVVGGNIIHLSLNTVFLNDQTKITI